MVWLAETATIGDKRSAIRIDAPFTATRGTPSTCPIGMIATQVGSRAVNARS
jgi:hypothetical protein